jgi:hypothetical protein
MITTKSKRVLRIGPEHQGRRMPLKVFEPALGQDGYVYELARGIVVVSEVANYVHAMLVAMVRNQLVLYQLSRPERIHAILGTMECKLLAPAFESERHPDIAVYFAPPLYRKGRTTWADWIPDLIVEVVSESSRDRDYVEKREEYWALGVKEYWIVDAERGLILALRRGKNNWIEKELQANDVLESKLLPGFRLTCKDVFAVAQA